MHRHKILLILGSSLALAADFSGESALRFTAKAVSFGPRPPGSAASHQLQAHIRGALKPLGCKVEEDAFTARTPKGAIRMTNIIARFAGASGRAIAISGHYDTKLFAERRFVGANDGGSSTGFLLEMARVLAGQPRRDDIYLVWFDGEEAIAAWSENDALHGSRHLARRWAADGTAARLKALINVDMIGDKDLSIVEEQYSVESLRRLVREVAGARGYGRYFFGASGSIEDDHVPFLKIGVNALDLIDFDYGPNNSYWHTEKDTMDKLSAASLEAVGRVVLEVVRKLEENR